MHETAKQKIINSRAEFPIKIYHSVSTNCREICPEPKIWQNHLYICQIGI